MRKLEIESWEELMAKELSVFDLPEDGTDEPLWSADADGVYEELCCGGARCEPRWELDPASAEDYPERGRRLRSGPAEKWRHFGH